MATKPIRQFPIHLPSCASPCAIRFQTHSNSYHWQHFILTLQLTGQYFIRYRHYTQDNHQYYFNTFIMWIQVPFFTLDITAQESEFCEICNSHGGVNESCLLGCHTVPLSYHLLVFSSAVAFHLNTLWRVSMCLCMCRCALTIITNVPQHVTE